MKRTLKNVIIIYKKSKKTVSTFLRLHERGMTMKDKTTAIILSALLGGLGVDRFYLGYTGMRVLKLLTGGCFGILWILDIINIASGKLQPADGSGYSSDNFGATNTAAPAAPTVDPYDELEKIAKLHDAGILTDEEFAKAKSNCLAKM